MARKPKDVFASHKNTASRRPFIECDYLDQLSPEELKWLAKFTDEYHGAGFDINTTYALKKSAIEVCQKELSKILKKVKDIEEFMKNPSKEYKKWQAKIEHFKSQDEKYVQISKNSKKKFDIDLRKCKSIVLYRKDENGELKRSKKYKYNSIHDFEKYGKECNERTTESRNDIYSNGRIINDEVNEFCVNNEIAKGYTPEEFFIWEENEEIIDDCGFLE